MGAGNRLRANWPHGPKQPELAHLTMAVNVSARQFKQSDFVDSVLTHPGLHTSANPSGSSWS
jgi:EAL domain-containing protein (putative c-di-GMP-specific phosphodiesterase class I)